MKTLAERISHALKESKKTQADLVRATKAKSSSVSNWVNGRTKDLKGANLAKAAEELGVSEAWLGAGVGPMERAGRAWPFRSISEGKIRALTQEERSRLEGAWTVAAAQIGIDVRPDAAPQDGAKNEGSPGVAARRFLAEDALQQETKKNDTKMTAVNERIRGSTRDGDDSSS